MDSPFETQILDALRTLVEEFKKTECGTWQTTEERLGVNRHRLQRFIDKDDPQDLKIRDLNSIYKAIHDHLRKNKESRLETLCSEQIALVYTGAGDKDNYRHFKTMVNINEDDQKSLSDEIQGVFWGVRKLSNNRFVVFHVRAVNTYSKFGLPTCRISRRLSEGGDLLIDGSIFTKNRHTYIIGYDKECGDILSCSLRKIDGNRLMKGFVSGFELTNSAFSSKIVIIKSINSPSYQETKEFTGIYDSIEEIIENIKDDFSETREMMDVMRSFDGESYMEIPAD